MGAHEGWTDGAVLRESERWVHVPEGGTRLEDGRRLLVILPEGWETSRVWRSRAPDAKRAGELIDATVAEVRARGGGRIVWHTGDRIAPPSMDECLAGRGFELKEELDVLAFVLWDATGVRMPRLTAPRGGLEAGLVRDAAELEEVLRVDAEVFGSPPPCGGEFAEYAGELEWLERLERGALSGEDVRGSLRFAARVSSGEEGDDGARRVVAAAGAQLVGETLRLWGASTREAYRGLGAYGALVRERCRFGRELGATLALAKANAATSSPILRRAGFRKVGTERRHVLYLSLQGGSRSG